MKKTSKPAPKTSAKKALVAKQSAAKPKTNPSAKSKPRKAQGQAELAQVVARLAVIADKLELVAERLTDATTGGPAARAPEAMTRQNPTPDTVT
jgi:hypothetical protein